MATPVYEIAEKLAAAGFKPRQAWAAAERLELYEEEGLDVSDPLRALRISRFIWFAADFPKPRPG